MRTNNIRTQKKRGRLGLFALVLACGVLAGAARADMIVSNKAGVVAGISGIVHYTDDNSIGVQFFVTAPTGTNLTTFTIQKSFDVKAWTNYSVSVTVTGSLPVTEIADFITASNQFYRMQLINFQ